ncbi:hypothetical protein [Candidatus Protochlamydia phocaeensis]|nr:hypothetical protein [Candidatus Protochlamydia phocaeensis]
MGSSHFRTADVAESKSLDKLMALAEQEKNAILSFNERKKSCN